MSAKNSKIFLFLIIILIFIFAIAFWPRHTKAVTPTAAIVKLSPVIIKPMPVIIELAGTALPEKTVSVQAQVTGTIKTINFQSGDIVTQGQLLLQLDPAPFIATLKQAEANLAQDQALVPSLQKEMKSYRILNKQGYISTLEYEQALGSYNEQVAKVAADKQAVEQAKISLNYTTIVAPIAGKTGNITLKQGDLVTANDAANPLVVINQIDPIEIDSYLPQSQLPILRQFYSQKEQNNIDVQIWDEKDSAQVAQGKLIFIDNQINNQTGTLLLKTNVDNSQHQLWPGQFVIARIILTVEPKAVVIPSIAIQSDQNGNFVYVVKDNQAKVVRVKINRQINTESVVTSGLTAGDNVITIAPSNLTDGSLVQVEK